MKARFTHHPVYKEFKYLGYNNIKVRNEFSRIRVLP